MNTQRIITGLNGSSKWGLCWGLLELRYSVTSSERWVWNWHVRVQHIHLNNREILFKVISWFRPCTAIRMCHWLKPGKRERRNQANNWKKEEVYAKQYWNYKCIDRGHINNKDKNIKWILKMKTRHSESGKGYFIAHPYWSNRFSACHCTVHLMVTVRGYREEHMSKISQHKEFVSHGREGENLGLKTHFY